LICLLPFVLAQQVGTNQQETHPSLSVQTCTRSGCTSQQRSIVLDSNWRWLHDKNLKNCFTGNEWDATLCPSPSACAQNCYIDGADYSATYGITTSGASLNIVFVTKGQYSTNIGSRVYLLQDEKTYQLLKLKNQEFTFDVDMSNLPCGLNGALYLSEMPADGGINVGNNKAGAKYGTGYCDAQCPHDMKFINGEANILGWKPSPNDPNAGIGQYGTCCVEMDIWEANSFATAYTPHVCTVNGLYRCNGTACGDGNNRYGGVCDKDGCDFNSFRQGDQNFLGKGKTIDTSKPFTVVTQFITKDNTSAGDLSEIRRVYVQNGKTVQNSFSTFSSLSKYNSVSDQYCADQKKLFNDQNDFQKKGGLKVLGQSLQRGMVLVMSLWDDHEAHMLWLDSDYPTDKSPSEPGIHRGPCATTTGVPTEVESQYPTANVKYFNIKYGDIGSTYKA